jgi:hypothetical protein
MTLWVYDQAGSLVNEAGDLLAEVADSGGLFVADVAESLHGTYDVVVTNSGSAVVFDLPGGLDTSVSYVVADRVSTSLLTSIASALPSAAAGSDGGLPTVDADNQIAGIQGSVNTLDELDFSSSTLTAQQVRDAMKLAPSAGNPAAGSVDEELDSIRSRTSTITTGTINVISHTYSGGTLKVKAGDSHLLSLNNAIHVLVDDPDQALYNQMTDNSVDSITVGFGRSGTADVFSGSVSPDNISHADGQTDIPIEIEATATASQKAVTGYSYDIQLTIGSESVTVVEGQADLIFDNAGIA